MQRKFIVCDPDVCAGCQLCEFACAWAKEGVLDLELSRIRLARPEPVVMMGIACRCCENAPCVAACPRDALKVNGHGIIELDKKRCSGCGWCIEACDFGAIAPDPRTKTVVICDLCLERDQPACVEACPKNALKLSSPEGVAGSARKNAAKRLAAEASGGKDGA